MNVTKLLCVAGAFVVSSSVSAQATRTWVSGTGDDANVCSRTAPCRTFAGAISKTATGGEIDSLDAGAYGAVTITKAITIDGSTVLSGVLVSSTNAIVINAPATADVVLRGLNINGIGTGLAAIRILAARSVTIENVNITGFTSHSIDVATTSDVRVELRNVVIQGSTSTLAGRAGVSLVGSTTAASPNIVALLDRVTVSGYPTGLDVGVSSIAHVENSRFLGNGIGVKAAVSSARATLSDSLVTNNGVGLSTAAVSPETPGQIISYNNNRLRGNTTDGAPTAAVYTR